MARPFRIPEHRPPNRRKSRHRCLAWALSSLMLAVGVPAAASPADVLLANPRGISDVALVAVAQHPGGSASYAITQDQADAALFQQIQRHGGGTIRLVCNPLPVQSDDAAVRATAIAQIMQLVDRINAAGLTVIVDLHNWPPGNPPQLSAALVSNATSRIQLGRALIEIAQQLKTRPAGRTALEVLNEPACRLMKGVDWQIVQGELYGDIRQVAPTLPLVLTGCNGLPDDLMRLDVGRYRGDPNAIFTFHFYEPFIFTHQTTYFGGIAFRRVPFPPTGSALGTVGAAAQHLPLGEALHSASAAHDLDLYLNSQQNPDFVAQRIHQVALWADRNGVPRNRIYLGEFGTSIRNRDDDTQAVWPDMLRWLTAVSTAAQREHFAYALWPPARPNGIFADPQNGFMRKDVLQAIGWKP